MNAHAVCALPELTRDSPVESKIPKIRVVVKSCEIYIEKKCGRMITCSRMTRRFFAFESIVD